MRVLAGHQDEEDHGRLLERVAEAIVRASSREIVPGSNGLLTEGPRYTLAADMVLGALYSTGTLPQLHPGERMPLIVVCSITTAFPSCVLGGLPRELGLLAAEFEAATVGRRAARLAPPVVAATSVLPATGPGPT
ncbi:hypothetical protein ACIQOV_04125 [Kitasatospora sp. NPDC091257]|uniref:hypothetical protein n=1 Tax=Kitasatospora sp. NPDC091257 TaxID=3364084 RepID=UPI0037F5FA9A